MEENFDLNTTLFNDTEYYVDDYFEVFAYSTPFTYVAYVAYSLVFVLGLIGNSLVFYTIHYTNPRMKTVQNYFLGNLALGDLLIVIFCIPTSSLDILLQHWPFGSLACHLLTPVKAIGVFVSSYTLVALATDRYLAILYPLKLGLRRGQAMGVIGIVWLGAVITAIPVAIYSRMEIHEGSGLERCGEYGWESYGQEVAYSFALLFLQYLFPVIVLIFTYARISIVVWGTSSSSRRSRNNQSFHSSSKGKKKTLVLSLIIVTAYTLSYLPYNIIYMVYKHGPISILDTDWFPYVFISCHFLAMAHAMFNPVIYFWINSRFRRAFVMVLVGKWPYACHCLLPLVSGDGERGSGRGGHNSSFISRRMGMGAGCTSGAGGHNGTRTMTIMDMDAGGGRSEIVLVGSLKRGKSNNNTAEVNV